MSTETIARRYGVALADAALTANNAVQIKDELANAAKLFGENAELKSVFENPAISHDNKEKVLDTIITRTRPSQMTANFLKVLLQNGRLGDIAEINDRFAQVLEERSGVISAEIISARELPAAERTEFEKSLERLTGKKVTISYAIDEALIGGAVTRIGSTVYDGSVRTKLENLKEQLVNG